MCDAEKGEEKQAAIKYVTTRQLDRALGAKGSGYATRLLVTRSVSRVHRASIVRTGTMVHSASVTHPVPVPGMPGAAVAVAGLTARRGFRCASCCGIQHGDIQYPGPIAFISLISTASTRRLHRTRPREQWSHATIACRLRGSSPTGGHHRASAQIWRRGRALMPEADREGSPRPPSPTASAHGVVRMVRILPIDPTAQGPRVVHSSPPAPRPAPSQQSCPARTPRSPRAQIGLVTSLSIS